MRLIKTEYNGNQVVKLFLIFYIRLYHMQLPVSNHFNQQNMS